MRIVGRVIKKVMAAPAGRDKQQIKETVVYPLYDKETGKELVQVHAIDARECLKSGRYTTEPPAGVEPVNEVVIDETKKEPEIPILPEVPTTEGSADEEDETLSRGGKKSATKK